MFGGITLVGPSLKLAAKTLGKGLAGHTVRAADPASKNWGKLRGAAGLGEGKELFRIPGAASLLTGVTKGVAYQSKVKNPFGLPAGIGVPLLFRKTGALAKKFKTKLGIPDYAHWKFSQFDLSTG